MQKSHLSFFFFVDAWHFHECKTYRKRDKEKLTKNGKGKNRRKEKMIVQGRNKSKFCLKLHKPDHLLQI